jgi:ABC-2 type transport system permease protein
MAIMAAFLLRFLLQLVLTTFCFWSEKAAAIDRLLMIPYMFLSGIVAPIDTFPPAVKRLAMATPFPWMIDFPARLIAGEPVNIALGFAAITAWCLLLLPICHLLWRAGLRRYSAMGA